LLNWICSVIWPCLLVLCARQCKVMFKDGGSDDVDRSASRATVKYAPLDSTLSII